MVRGVARLTSLEPIAPLVDAPHIELARRVSAIAAESIAPRREVFGNDDVRGEARALLGIMAEARLYDPIESRDLRAFCLTREIVAGASTLADAVLALQALGAMPIVLAGTDAQRVRWLDAIRTGRVMAAFAMTEPEAGSDVAAIRTSARRENGGWVLDGEKHLISNGGIADLYVVFAVTTPNAGSRGLTAFLVPAASPGLTLVAAQQLAAPHPLGHLRLAACRVSADAVIGEIDRGFTLGMMALDWARPSVGAAACGMAARALIAAAEHARSRRQFGEPLASFQLTREKIGRMATDLQAARLLVYRAAWQKDNGAEQITLEAAMAKSFATEAAQRIIDDAVQIAGGVGVLVGNPIERLYRAVRAMRIYEGTTEIHRLVIAKELLEPS